MIGTCKGGTIRREKRWWLTLVLILLMPLSGCAIDRQVSQSLLYDDNSRFMDLWSTYTHCYRSEDPDAMRADAQQLSRAVHTIDSVRDPITPEGNEPVPPGPTSRLSVDPAEMAASCALHAGQFAKEIGHLDIAREMFQMVVINYSQPRYQYYTDQARRGLEHLNAASRVGFTRPHRVRTCQHDI
ncbi:MAG: hypothetical protein ACREJN_11225 [Nitrospiraceae bacterium]